MPGGGCMGGIPGLGPGKPAGPGGLMTGAPGDPSWLSVPASEDAPLFPALSLDESSFVFTGSAAAGEKPAERKHVHIKLGTTICKFS